MGAHTLGQVVAEHTGGFVGFWTPGKEDVFNTTYFDLMISQQLHYVNVVRVQVELQAAVYTFV